MVIAFIIWSIVAILFALIGVSTYRSRKEAGFFTFVKPPKMKDVVKYNHAVGKLWFVFAAILEVLGIPFLFLEQNSPVVVFLILALMLLVIAISIAYIKIEGKYRERQ